MSRVMFSRKTAPKTSAPMAAVQSSVTKTIKPGDKSVFLDPLGAQKYGFVHTPSPSEYQKYTATQLYELAYGGSIDYFNNTVFSKATSLEETLLQDLSSGANVTEGAKTCPACGYNRIISSAKQLNAGDEGQKELNLCARCGKRWAVQ